MHLTVSAREELIHFESKIRILRDLFHPVGMLAVGSIPNFGQFMEPRENLRNFTSFLNKLQISTFRTQLVELGIVEDEKRKIQQHYFEPTEEYR